MCPLVCVYLPSVFPIFFPHITLPFTPTFGCGVIESYFVVKPNLAHNLCLLGIIGFNTQLYSTRSAAPPPKTIVVICIYLSLTYLWVNKSYLLVEE